MDWNEILEMVLKLIISVALPVLLKLLFDWIKVQKGKLEQSLDAETRYIVQEAVRIAVLAAEQSGLAGLIGKEYKGKKEYAIALAENWLLEYGVTIDLNVLAGMIEAAVMEEFNRKDASAIRVTTL